MKKKTLALAMMVGVAVIAICGCSKPADDAAGTAGGSTAAGASTAAGTAGSTTG